MDETTTRATLAEIEAYLAAAVRLVRTLPHQRLPGAMIEVKLGSSVGAVAALRVAGGQVETRRSQSLGEVYDLATLTGDGYVILAHSNWRAAPECTCVVQP